MEGVRYSATSATAGLFGTAVVVVLVWWVHAGHGCSIPGTAGDWNEHGAYKRDLSDPAVAHVRGRAVLGSRGVGGVEITATVLPTGMGWTVDTVTTGPDGTFDVPVTSNHLEHRQLVWLDAHGPSFGHTELEVAPGQVIENVTMRVGPGFVVRGTVVDRSGAPVAGVRVRDGKRSIARSTTDAAGRFEIVFTTPGRHRLHVSRDTGGTFEIPQLVRPSRSFDVVDLDGDVEGVQLQVDADGGIDGLVVDEQGQAVPRATLQQARTSAATPPSDQQGRFRWRPTLGSPYVLSAVAGDRSGFFSGDEVPWKGVTITVARSGHLTVHCGSFPATSLDISRDRFGVQPQCEQEVALPPGTYRVIGRAHDGTLATATATVEAARSTEATLAPTRSIQLRARLTALGETPPTPYGWCRTLLPLAVAPEYEIDRNPYSSVREFTLKSPEGPIDVLCDPAGFVPSRITTVVRDGELVEIPVVAEAENAIDLGVELRTDPKGALVVGVADEAAAAGLENGDLVVGVNGASVIGLSANAVFELGFDLPPGHPVSWTVVRGGTRLELHASTPGPYAPPVYFR